MVIEAPQYRGVKTGTKLITGAVAAIIIGVGSYIAIDHFGPQLHLGMQDIPTKIVEAGGVGLWAGLSTVGILAEARVPIRQNSQLRRTGPLKNTS